MQTSFAWALGDNVFCSCFCPGSAWAPLARRVPAVNRVGPAGMGTGRSPTPLGDTRGSQHHSLSWEEESWGEDPIIHHLHALAWELVKAMRLPCEQGLVVAQTSAQHWGVGTSVPASGLSLPLQVHGGCR